MRSLSLNFREALFSQESGDVPALLVTITHPDLEVPINLSTDPSARLSTTPLLYGTVSRGRQYLYIGMEVLLPDEKDKTPPQSRITFSNVGRENVDLLRSITSPPSVKIEGVLASDPDVVEFEVPALDVVHIEINADQVTMELAMDSLSGEPLPAGSFDPASFPALFAA